MEQKIAMTIVVLCFVAALVFGVLFIVWSNQCAAAGGAYIIPQNSWPVCVQGVR